MNLSPLAQSLYAPSLPAANSTPISNVILDGWMPFLSGAELNLVLYVAARCSGKGMSIRALSDGCHIQPSSVQRAIGSLADKGILLRQKLTDGSKLSCYSLNMDADFGWRDCADPDILKDRESYSIDSDSGPTTARRTRRTFQKKRTRTTKSRFAKMCEAYGGICLCCGLVKPLTLDHVVPVSKGGSNDPSNWQPLCRRCNSVKGVKTIDYRPLPPS